MAFSLTIVSREVVWCDGRLLVEFTDGGLRDYAFYARPNDLTLRMLRHQTHESIVETCRESNRLHIVTCRANLHLSKVQRFGHGYQHRGY